MMTMQDKECKLNGTMCQDTTFVVKIRIVICKFQYLTGISTVNDESLVWSKFGKTAYRNQLDSIKVI